MKVLFLSVQPADSSAGYCLAPYLLKGYAEKHGPAGLSVHVLNAKTTQASAELAHVIAAEQPDCVASSCYCWNTSAVLAVMAELRGISTAVRILGGPDVSLDTIPSMAERGGVDYFVIGEGERPFAELLARIADEPLGALVVQLPAGVVRWQSGQIQTGPPSDDLADLDEVPSAYLSGAIDRELYAGRQAFVETMRGCRRRCSYCFYSKNRRRMSNFSLERVFTELDFLIVEQRVSALRFIDPSFTVDLPRAKLMVAHLFELKARVRGRLPWIYWDADYEQCDEEFVRMVSRLKYRDSICNYDAVEAIDEPQHYSDLLFDYTVIFDVGVQSLCDDSLLAVRRPPNRKEKLSEFLRWAQRHNVALKIDMILGLPHERFESFFAGLDFIIDHLYKTDHVLNIHRLLVLPGSDLAARHSELGLLCDDGSHGAVRATPSLPRPEMQRAARLSALLVRVVNSPLRSAFLAARENRSLLDVLLDLWDRIEQDNVAAGTPLRVNDEVDDAYWADQVFRDLPTDWLRTALSDGKSAWRPAAQPQ
jgi:radical SAM superfamily enzyme YgiQ (UPF0313 family)